MIIVINRALGILNGGGEIFDMSVTLHILKKLDDIQIYSGGMKGTEKLTIYNNIQINAINSPFLRSLAYRFKSGSKIAAVFYTLDNFLFEVVVILKILVRGKRLKSELNIVYCCSLFFIPYCLSKRYPQTQFVSWLPGPPGKIALAIIKLLKLRQNFHLFTHGYPEQSLIDNGLIKNKDFFLIPPGLSEDFKTKTVPRNVSGDCIKGLTVARLVPIKDIEFLIECLFECKQKKFNFHWTIIGDGPLLQTIKSLVESLGLVSHISLLGQRTQSEIKNILDHTDVFALSSEFENYSLAVIEAFSGGVPCLLRDVGYLPKLIGANTRGATFNCIEGFYASLMAIVNDPIKYRQMSLLCLEFAAEHSWKKNARIFHENVTSIRKTEYV